MDDPQAVALAVKKAKAKRRGIKGGLTRAETFLDQSGDNVGIAQLRARRTKIEATWDEFDEAQIEIDLASGDEITLVEREQFEEQYFRVISRFDETIAILENDREPLARIGGSNEIRDVVQERVSDNLRLPKIELPTFSGGYEEWYPFYDTFQSLIHNVERIPNIQKFHYLKSSLRGEAADVIRSLEISADNYGEAWQMLRQRYDNKRLIVQKHIKAIFDLPVVTKEGHASLRALIDGVLKHKRALRALGRATNEWDDLLVHLVTSKLDAVTNREWENSLKEPDIPTLQELTEFLEHRCHTLEIIQRRSSQVSESSTNSKQRQPRSTASNVATQNKSCTFCSGEHFVFSCEALLRMSAQERSKAIRDRNLCLNCLRTTSHQAKDCPSGNCKNCGKKHNTLLHFGSSSGSQRESQKNLNQNDSSSRVSTVTHARHDCDNFQVWLSTAIIEVLDVDGKPISCRVLLDPGSQSNLMTEALAKKLKLPFQVTSVPIVGVNQVLSLAQSVVNVSLRSKYYSFGRKVDCLILKQITDKLPSMLLRRVGMNIPQNLRLADPNFHIPGSIDMLIGATIFWEILCVGQIKATEEHPVLQKTLFGWILGGSSKFASPASSRVVCNMITNQQLDKSLTRFWETEQLVEQAQHSAEEKSCEEFFARTHRRNEDGRFVVKLPFKESKLEQLGESRDIALRRFHALERKLKRNPDLRAQYVEFIDEYRRLGHMELIRHQELPPTGYYLPHHPVIKETSLTTKLRVVFDASCKTSTGVSLNDVLMVGPTLQRDLVDIILRFRVWQHVMTADVEKMYRQVLIDPSQTRYQRILWRTDPAEEVKTFELQTVTYGTASASFLAIRSLQETARREKAVFPEGAAAVLSDFYVDDLLTGADDLERAGVIRDEIIAILSKCGFRLRKWASNSPELIQGFADANAAEPLLTLDKSDHISTLGLQWHAVGDTLQYEVRQTASPGAVTKRSILSSISRIFDPLGLLGPVIVAGKILMQRLWSLQIGWDETVPAEIETHWRAYENQLSQLNTLKISRRVIACSRPRLIEIHGFCDASMSAFGAAVYIKTTSFDGERQVRLLCAKSRVAPVKSITLPRLELCAAHLLAQLTYRISRSLGIKLNGIFHWSDSTVALGWIKADANRWSTFVSNRVGQIQELTDSSSWSHVNTKENPADAISRGIPPSQLIQSQLWWNGPRWLVAEAIDFNESPPDAPRLEELPEARKTSLAATYPPKEWEIFYTMSTANRLIRVTAYILRFLDNARTDKRDRQIGPLVAQEINRANTQVAKVVQGYSFPAEFKALQDKKALPRGSKLLGLSPFIDKAGVIRVGGRLSHSQLSFSTKYPIVLPAKHNFTKMLIEREHEKLLHAGPHTTLASLRQRFWPIAGRNTVRQITRKCIKCFRAAPTARPVIMGDLPAPRVSPAPRPFLHCGLDYCGPFMVRESRKRNAKLSKAYVAVFVCLACKAVHLELVFDLSTESFLSAFKRFISRRGVPSDIYCDNGTNFIGASRELKELRREFLKEINQDSVNDFSAQQGISWHFIPPRSPHFGGLWEAAVKSMKFHLKRATAAASLVYDELQTVLAQIEAVLNSRPLTPLSSNPNDHTFLSPAHFLIGDNFAALSEPTLLDVKENRLSRWQRVEQIKQHFWKKWSVNYLNELQQRTKWKTEARSLKPGDLVIVREDNMPPLSWSLARIETVHPGADGVVRTATVKTTKGVYKRPATRLCPLPFDNENATE